MCRFARHWSPRRRRNPVRARPLRVALVILLLLGLSARDATAVSEVVVLGLFRDRAVVKIDGQQRVLSVGKSSPEGVTLVSSNSREAVLEIDGKQATYTLGTQIGTRFQPPAPGTTVTIAPDISGMYQVGGSINGFQVEFIVDTGATVVALNRNEARRMGIDYRMLGRKAVSDTAAGPDPVYLVNLSRVRVGDIELTDVQGAVHEGDHPTAILLGNSFLGRVDLQRQGDLLLLKSK